MKTEITKQIAKNLIRNNDLRWENETRITSKSLTENFLLISSGDKLSITHKQDDFYIHDVSIKGLFVVSEFGIAAANGTYNYYGFFTSMQKAQKFIEEAIDTCMSNESFNENDEDEFENSKSEMKAKFVDCYDILESDDLNINFSHFQEK